MARKETAVDYSTVRLFKSEVLGIGSYGAVYKARCGDLSCAAKVLHPTLLYDPTIQDRTDHRLPFRRFERECEFMSSIRHPNVVQYLGMQQDPETGLPALLMELMDNSLTCYLESSTDPVPYHMQLNYCYDVSLALSYLHSNGVIHRDLSSNNVLLVGNVKAKVTDFGMARLGDLSSEMRQRPNTFTVCPGTCVYMPPEATVEHPVYTEKIDCFSLGVLIIQILTKKFPKPADQLVQVNPAGQTYVRISEVERRQNHMSEISPIHPLLHIIHQCLHNDPSQRPSATDLCSRFRAMKESTQYSDSATASQVNMLLQERQTEITTLQQRIRDLEVQHAEEVEALERRHTVQTRGLQAVMRQQSDRLRQTIHSQQQEIRQHQESIQARDEAIEAQRHESLEKDRLFQGKIRLIERTSQQLLELSELVPDRKSRIGTKDRIKLVWRQVRKAPCTMYRVTDAVVDNKTVYLRPGDSQALYAYNMSTNSWTQLPDCVTEYCSLAMVNNLLTTVGGENSNHDITNQLFSFKDDSGSKRWLEEYPPMPTKRNSSISVFTKRVLVVAGGEGEITVVNAVEVLNFDTLTWSTAASLPEPLGGASATICGSSIFIVGGWHGPDVPTNSVYTCSLSALFESCHRGSASSRATAVWSQITDLPVTSSTCVTLYGQLMAIGGWALDRESNAAIYVYNTITNSWRVVSHMSIGRCLCFAAILPENKLIVAGGCTNMWLSSETDTVEIAESILRT